MDLLEQTKKLCKLYHIIPARSRGQNFLIKEEVYDKIIEAAELTGNDTVLEVGPGLGFLTTKLAVRANSRSPVQKVIAVELDKKLVEILKTRLAKGKIKNVEVVNEDILKFSIFPANAGHRHGGGNFSARGGSAFGGQFSNNFQFSNFKIVANLPYNITSIFLRKFLSIEIKLKLMVLMLQKEVAQRITAKPPKMSLLAVSVQYYAEAKIIEYVSKENFWPEPEVDSAIIKITPHPQPLPRSFFAGEGQVRVPFSHACPDRSIGKVMNGRKAGIEGVVVDKERDFFRLVKFGFSAKRKMLKNNLAAGYEISAKEAENKLKMAGFNEKVRAQELSIEDWLKLSGEFRSNMV